MIIGIVVKWFLESEVVFCLEYWFRVGEVSWGVIVVLGFFIIFEVDVRFFLFRDWFGV